MGVSATVHLEIAADWNARHQDTKTRTQRTDVV